MVTDCGCVSVVFVPLLPFKPILLAILFFCFCCCCLLLLLSGCCLLLCVQIRRGGRVRRGLVVRRWCGRGCRSRLGLEGDGGSFGFVWNCRRRRRYGSSAAPRWRGLFASQDRAASRGLMWSVALYARAAIGREAKNPSGCEGRDE